jgi:hypothetical protein
LLQPANRKVNAANKERIKSTWAKRPLGRKHTEDVCMTALC